MNLDRRDFLKSTLTASAAAVAFGGTASSRAATAPAGSSHGSREYYEIRSYRLKPDAPHALLDSYLDKAFIPALNRRGIKTVGVFTEPEAKDGLAIWVLIPHPNLDSVASIAGELNADPKVREAGTEYLMSPGIKTPAFDRVDSWLLVAFQGLPQMAVPAFARTGESRVYELRTYESFSEVTALKKVEMFNAGEIGVMQELNMSPVFYGQALVGRDLPHLTYMLSSPDRETLAKSWTTFGKHPVWNKLKADPQYADTVSKITSRMLKPTPYSQL